jgi:hypothetical protein
MKTLEGIEMTLRQQIQTPTTKRRHCRTFNLIKGILKKESVSFLDIALRPLDLSVMQDGSVGLVD